MNDEEKQSMEEVILSEGRYPPEAYGFLHEGLSHAAKKVHGVPAAQTGEHHVTGQEICEALRELAIERWGMMAKTVLEKWNIRATTDFGNMVYLMIEHGFMHKTEDDFIEDFRDVFDFHKAFGTEGQIELRE